jgi:hypothetical protein
MLSVRQTIFRLVILVTLIGIHSTTNAQLNSPFSRYGLGNEIYNSQNATSQGMGGFSTAYTTSMNGNYGQSINFNNPASFGGLYMTTFDLGLHYTNNVLRNNDSSARSKNNYLVPGYVAIGFPLSKEKKIGLSFGFTPLTTVKYSSNSFSVLSTNDTIVNNYLGDGGMNQLYFGIGKSWKYASIGASTGYNFGRKDIDLVQTSIYSDNLLHQSDSTYFYQSKYSTHTNYGAPFLKLGFLSDFPLLVQSVPNSKEKIEWGLNIGATYTLGQTMNAYTDIKRSIGSYNTTTETNLDTAMLSNDNVGRIKMPTSQSFAIAFHKKKLATRGNYDQIVVGLEMNQTYWGDQFLYLGKTDLVSNNYMYRFGVMYNPDPYDFQSYWSMVTYRAGFYTGKDYINVDGLGMKVNAFTAGMSLPIRKYRSYDYQYSVLNLAFQIGKRGTSVNKFSESFMQFTVGYSLSDIWFNKRKYD